MVSSSGKLGLVSRTLTRINGNECAGLGLGLTSFNNVNYSATKVADHKGDICALKTGSTAGGIQTSPSGGSKTYCYYSNAVGSGLNYWLDELTIVFRLTNTTKTGNGSGMFQLFGHIGYTDRQAYWNSFFDVHLNDNTYAYDSAYYSYIAANSANSAGTYNSGYLTLANVFAVTNDVVAITHSKSTRTFKIYSGTNGLLYTYTYASGKDIINYGGEPFSVILGHFGGDGSSAIRTTDATFSNVYLYRRELTATEINNAFKNF